LGPLLGYQWTCNRVCVSGEMDVRHPCLTSSRDNGWSRGVCSTARGRSHQLTCKPLGPSSLGGRQATWLLLRARPHAGLLQTLSVTCMPKPVSMRGCAVAQGTLWGDICQGAIARPASWHTVHHKGWPVTSFRVIRMDGTRALHGAHAGAALCLTTGAAGSCCIVLLTGDCPCSPPQQPAGH
jgi:hypothetical protein